MFKSSKRMLSLLIVLALVLACLPMAVFAADTTTVYYYNGASNWATVSVHYWGGADGATSWPGIAATDLGNGYWSVDVPTDVTGLLFNNGGNGSQTGDLTLPTDGTNCYAGGSWIEYTGGEIEVQVNTLYVDALACGWASVNAYWWDGSYASGSWPGVAMTLVEGNIYSVEVPTDTTTIIFNYGSSQTADLAVPGDGYIWNGSEFVDYATYVPEQGEIEVAYYIRGDMNSWGADDSNKMTDNGDGTYTYSIELAAGTYEYKAADASWTEAWPKNEDNSNAVVTVETDCVVTFVLDTVAGTITATGDGLGGGEVVDPVDPVVNYYVAGDEALTGYPWQADGVLMNANEDGTYSVTFPAVAAGDYQFKVTDGTWDNSWGKDGGNVEITVEAEADVTVTFDPTTGAITYTGAIETPAAPLEWGYINVVGNGSGNWLFGEEWNVDSWNNGLKPDVDGTMLTVWTATYTGVAAGSYQFKIAADSAWDIAWATGEYMESGVTYTAWFGAYGNSSFEVLEDNSTVTITLDTTNMDPVTGEGATLCVTVEAAATAVVPEELALGNNNYTVVDSTVAASTFVATESGILTVTPTALTIDGEMAPAAMMFGRGMFSIVVDGVVYSNQTSVNVEVKAGMVYEIGIIDNAGAVADVTLFLAMDAYDVMAQITAGTTAESASTNLRLITYADTLDYANIVVSVTVGGNTVEYTCTDVYGTINADGVSISNPGNVFEGANYFVTFTLDGVPAAAFDSEIVVSVTWENLDGTYVFGNSRTIVISDRF